MEIRIRLPGLSLDSDRAIAPLLAAVAVEQGYQLLPPTSPPANSTNACANDPDCVFLKNITEGGNTWAVYLCNGVIVSYRV
jgi:hypothetical protein